MWWLGAPPTYPLMPDACIRDWGLLNGAGHLLLAQLLGCLPLHLFTCLHLDLTCSFLLLTYFLLWTGQPLALQLEEFPSPSLTPTASAETPSRHWFCFLSTTLISQFPNSIVFCCSLFNLESFCNPCIFMHIYCMLCDMKVNNDWNKRTYIDAKVGEFYGKLLLLKWLNLAIQ